MSDNNKPSVRVIGNAEELLAYSLALETEAQGGRRLRYQLL